MSYMKGLSWSGLGFAFLITALCIQVYPLINTFWSKAGIQDNATVTNFSTKELNQLYLSNSEVTFGGQVYGSTITNGLKCALAIVAAFSSVLGRVGSL
jgi:hypothetical protein